MCFLMKNNLLTKTDWSFVENHMLGQLDFFNSNYLYNLSNKNIYENEIKIEIEVPINAGIVKGISGMLFWKIWVI